MHKKGVDFWCVDDVNTHQKNRTSRRGRDQRLFRQREKGTRVWGCTPSDDEEDLVKRVFFRYPWRWCRHQSESQVSPLLMCAWHKHHMNNLDMQAKHPSPMNTSWRVRREKDQCTDRRDHISKKISPACSRVLLIDNTRTNYLLWCAVEEFLIAIISVSTRERFLSSHVNITDRSRQMTLFFWSVESKMDERCKGTLSTFAASSSTMNSGLIRTKLLFSSDRFSLTSPFPFNCSHASMITSFMCAIYCATNICPHRRSNIQRFSSSYSRVYSFDKQQKHF